MPVLRALLQASGALLAGAGGGLCYGYFSCNSWMFDNVFMPATRCTCVDPERAHVLAVKLAARGLVPRDKSRDPDILVSILLWGVGVGGGRNTSIESDLHKMVEDVVLD